MKTINSATTLNAAILYLENKQADEGKMLKEEFHLAYESIQPVNMLKSTIKELAHAQEFKENLLTLSVNLTAGYLAKKLSKGSSNQPLKKLLGAVIIFGITKFLARRAYVLISVPLTDTGQSE